MRTPLPMPASRLIAGLAIALCGALALPCSALAQDAAATASASAPLVGAPVGFIAPAEPKADDSNAQRARSQPGNNAPFWRKVRESGVDRKSTRLNSSHG